MANPGSLRRFSEVMGLAVGGVVCQYPGLLGEEPPSYTCPWYSSLDLLREVPDLAILTRGSLGHFEADFAIDSANRGIPSACDPSRPIYLSSCRLYSSAQPRIGHFGHQGARTAAAAVELGSCRDQAR